MPLAISKRGLDLIKDFESFVPYVYDDLVAPVGGKYREWDGGAVKGTLTIGYGHTDAAKHPLKIMPWLRISEAQAVQILDVDLDECEAAVNSLVKVPLTQGQFDALTSFAFNCGTGNLKKLIVPLNAGDYAACRDKFDEFVRSKGQVLRGLVRRRDAEQALFDSRDGLAPPAKPENTTAGAIIVAGGAVAGGAKAGGAQNHVVGSIIMGTLIIAAVIFIVMKARK